MLQNESEKKSCLCKVRTMRQLDEDLQLSLHFFFRRWVTKNLNTGCNGSQLWVLSHETLQQILSIFIFHEYVVQGDLLHWPPPPAAGPEPATKVELGTDRVSIGELLVAPTPITQAYCHFVVLVHSKAGHRMSVLIGRAQCNSRGTAEIQFFQIGKEIDEKLQHPIAASDVIQVQLLDIRALDPVLFQFREHSTPECFANEVSISEQEESTNRRCIPKQKEFPD